MRTAIVLFALLVALVAAQDTPSNYYFTVSNFPTSLYVNQQSEWIYVTASNSFNKTTGDGQATLPVPETTLQIVVSVDSSAPGTDNVNAGALQFLSATSTSASSSITVTINPTTLQGSFRIVGSAVQDGKTLDSNGNTLSPYRITFVSNQDVLSPGAYSQNKTVAINPIDIELTDFNTYFSSSQLIMPVAYPTEPFKISLAYPVQSGLTVIPHFTNADVQFNPSQINIPAKSIAGSFSMQCNSVTAEASAETLWFELAGADAANYNVGAINGSTFAFFCSQREVFVPSFSSVAVVGNTSNALWVAIPDVVNGSAVTITPYAADTTFKPVTGSSLSVSSAGKQVAAFQYTVNSVANASTTRDVLFTVSGDNGNYFGTFGSSFSVAPRRFNVHVPTSMVLGVTSKLSIYVNDVVANGVTVNFFAANLKFSAASVTFAKGQSGPQGISVDVTPTNLGSDEISFWVSGDDAAWYYPIAAVDVSIVRKSFIVNDQFYGAQTLFVGQPSDPINIRVNVAPTTSVTLTPVCPDFIFVPPSLTFTTKNIEQTLTIIPSNSAVTSSSSIEWLVSGDDWSSFETPDSVTLPEINKRLFQAVWSSDIEVGHQFATGGPSQYNPSSTKSVQLGKKNTVWASVNYAGGKDQLIVTPTSPYFTFSPSQLTFNSGSTRVSFTATAIAQASADVGTPVITYVFSGASAGYYSDDIAYTQAVDIQVRTLTWWSALLSYDNREQGRLIYNEVNGGDLNTGVTFTQVVAANNVKAFSVAHFHPVDSSLTITPKCQHVSFSPSSVTFKPNTHTNYAKNYNVLGAKSSNGGQFNYSIEFPSYVSVANFTAKVNAPGFHYVHFELSGGDASYFQNPGMTLMNFQQYSASSAVVASLALVFAAIALVL